MAFLFMQIVFLAFAALVKPVALVEMEQVTIAAAETALAGGPGVIELADAQFKQQVRGASGPVLVVFWAEWCGPCRMLNPPLHDLAQEMAGKLVVAKLNIDNNPQAAMDHHVASIPTLMLFENGRPIRTRVGVLDKAQLEAWVTGGDAALEKATVKKKPAPEPSSSPEWDGCEMC